MPEINDTTEEIWKPVPGWEAYSVSTCGRVRRDKPGKNALVGKILKQRTYPYRYSEVSLNRPGQNTIVRLVHHLVATAFLGSRPKGHEINHINGIKSDNRVENLEYVTHRQNAAHGYRIGLMHPPRGQDHCHTKLTEDDVMEIRHLRRQGVRIKEIQERFHVSQPCISQICLRISWRHLP